MKKTIITTFIALALVVSILVPVTFASEVIGQLSSGGATSQNQSNGQTSSGTITGTVNSQNGNSGGGNGGGGGGNSGTPLVQSQTSSGSQTTPSGSVEGASISGNALAAPARTFAVRTGGTAQNFGAPSDESDQVAINNLSGDVQASIPLAAAAGDAAPLSGKFAWTIFILAVALLIGYGFYRKYGPVRNNRNLTLE